MRGQRGRRRDLHSRSGYRRVDSVNLCKGVHDFHLGAVDPREIWILRYWMNHNRLTAISPGLNTSCWSNCQRLNLFSDLPDSMLTFWRKSLIILMTFGITTLSGFSSEVYFNTCSKSSGYLANRVVGLVKYPFNSSFRDSGRLSVSLQIISHKIVPEAGFNYLNKLSEGRVWALLFLKFVLAIQLMTSVHDEWFEERHCFKENISYSLNNSIWSLAFVQSIPQSRINSNDVLQVPEHLLKEVRPPWFFNHV